MVSQFKQGVVDKIKDSLTEAFREAATPSAQAFAEKFKQELLRVGDDLFSQVLFGDKTPEESSAEYLKTEMDSLAEAMAKAEGHLHVLKDLNKSAKDKDFADAIKKANDELAKLRDNFNKLKGEHAIAKLFADVEQATKDMIDTFIHMRTQDAAQRMVDDLRMQAQAMAQIPVTSEQYISGVANALSRQDKIVSTLSSSLYEAYEKLQLASYQLDELDRMGAGSTEDRIRLQQEILKLYQQINEETATLAAAERNLSALKIAEEFSQLGKSIQTDIVSAMVGNTGWHQIEKKAADAFRQSIENAFKMAGPGMRNALMNIMYGTISSNNIGAYLHDSQFSDVEKTVLSLVATIQGKLGGFGADVDRFTELAINLPSSFADVMPSVVDLQRAAGQFLNLDGLSPIEENTKSIYDLTNAITNLDAVIASSDIINVDVETTRAQERLIGTMNSLTGAIKDLNNNIRARAGKEFAPYSDRDTNNIMVPNDVIPRAATGARSIGTNAVSRIKERKTSQ
jgi:hypothetical protein